MIRENRQCAFGGGDHRPTAKLVIGLFAIVIGILFLLDHRGIIQIQDFWRFWPVVFIAIGVGKLFERNNPDKMMGAGVMFIIGSVFLLINFGYFGWGQIWPVALIGIGVLMLLQAIRPGHRSDPVLGPLDSNAVFSSIEKNINERDFTGGRVHTVFGSVELDLRNADMQGEKASIDANVVFGSVEMKIPDTWKVEVEAGAVFGSCENKTRAPLATASPKTLVIRGDIVFGSIEIRN